eukprot:CAMPEP_0201487030 /NCGR_PEP_ID=MMETSP0151_2-20130828/11039_1 /ASSEMBLY_ACC=CAM_ASM_000257 /TAXON_ID=200890 /ORGANISM="Paramoeba atlantica, Strain 621/1 / CCAP 1560/9" /LENGTH=178 /DNA_ID=CAMNT_0047871947 /DNA_START=120 /DNA_END=652 /DNA_ORIENTATION=+
MGKVSWRNMDCHLESKNKWEDGQVFMMVSWLNYQLEQGGYDPIEKLDELDNGLVLRRVLEILSGQTVKGKFNANPKMSLQRISNLTLGFDFMAKEGIKLVNIGPVDIEEKKKSSQMGLVWSLIQHYLIDKPSSSSSPSSNEGGTPPDPEEELLGWAFNQCRKYGMEKHQMVQWMADGR